MAKIRYEPGDILEVIGNVQGHPFDTGTIVEVIRYNPVTDEYDVCQKPTGDCWWLKYEEVKLFKDTIKMSQPMQVMKDAVRDTARKLIASNGSTTTKEVKEQLRIELPQYHWIQYDNGRVRGVSELMDELAGEGLFEFTFNGIFREYVLPNGVIPVGTPNSTGMSTPAANSKMLVGGGTNNTPTTQNPLTTNAAAVTTSGILVIASVLKPGVNTIKKNDVVNFLSKTNGDFRSATFTDEKGAVDVVGPVKIRAQKKSIAGYVKQRLSRLSCFNLDGIVYEVQ